MKSLFSFLENGECGRHLLFLTSSVHLPFMPSLPFTRGAAAGSPPQPPGGGGDPHDLDLGLGFTVPWPAVVSAGKGS